MSGLREYLTEKRGLVLARKERPTASLQPHPLSARVRAESRSGVRRIRVRDFQILSDSGPDFAGYDLGPGSPELALGALGSCLTHIFLIQAAAQDVPLDSLEVEIQGQMDPRAGRPGYEAVPVYPHNINYTVHIGSNASDETLAELHEAVERVCPVLNLLVNPQQITGRIVHSLTDAKPAASGAAGAH